MAKKTRYIHSQMLSIENNSLVLPNTAVAEIINFTDPVPVEDSPDWLLGTMEWRGLSVPLISLEKAMGKDAPDVTSDLHIAILNCLGNKKSFNFYGIITRGLPKLVNIQEKNILEGNNTNELNELALANVTINKMEAFIPDLDAIEALFKGTGIKNTHVS